VAVFAGTSVCTSATPGTAASLAIQGESPLLAAERALSLARQVVRLRLLQLADHAIRCGSGYVSAVCPTGVCPPPPP
jgi:hypothetical protein